MIKLKLINLRDVLNSLGAVSEKEIPRDLSYKIAKLIKSLLLEFEVFEEQRGKLIGKYAIKDKDGKLIIKNNAYDFTDENRGKYQGELAELGDIEADIPFEPITLKALFPEEQSTVAPKHLVVLDKFIVEDSKEQDNNEKGE